MASLFTVALALSSLSRTLAECTKDSSQKTDCGFLGIDQAGCEDKGCCWAAVEGDPYCFYQDGSGDDNTAGDDGGDATNCFILAANASEPFSEEEVETMRGFFLANVNIEGKGTVVAGYNDASAVGGSYYYQ